MIGVKRSWSVGRLAAATVLASVALAGCSEDGPSPTESPTQAAPSPSPTQSSPPTESEAASEAASAVLRTYFATVDLVRQDSSVPPSELDTVASSTQLTAQQNLLKSQRDDGLHQVGDTQIIELKVESVSLDSPATALIDVCWDVSDVDIVDAEGDSAVASERKEVGWTRYTVTNDKWDAAPEDGWRVSGGADLEKEPCVAS